MLVLDAAKTLQGVAGTATAITVTVTGDEKTTSDAFKVLYQGQLPSSAGVLYTVPGSTVALVKSITLTNTTGSAVTGVKLYVGGSAGTNLITSLTLPANGSAIFNGEYLQVFDATGSALTAPVGLAAIATSGSAADLITGTIPAARFPAFTGDATSVAGGVALTLASVGTAGTYGSASSVPVLQTDAKGRVIAVTPTAIAIASGAVSGLAASATTDTTNAANISSGILPDARLSNTITAAGPVGGAATALTITYDAHGRLSAVTPVAIAIASGAVSGLAASATTDTTNAANIGSGTLPAGRLPALTGDITATIGTVATTLTNSVVTNAKLANVTGPVVKGLSTGTGAPVDLSMATLAGSAMLNLAATYQATNANLTTIGALAPANGDILEWTAGAWANRTPAQVKATLAISLSADVTGTLQAAQFPALTGAITTSAGSLATTLSASAVANSNLANMTGPSVKGISTGTGAPVDLSMATLAGSSMLNLAATYQPLTTTLTTLGGLAQTAGNFIYSSAGTWTSAPLTPSLVSGFDTQVRTSRLDQMAAPTSAVTFNGQKITSLADGSGAQDGATFHQIGDAITAAASNYVPTARTISTTLPLTGGGALSSNLSFGINLATTSANGAMAALDKLKLDGLWIDITANSIATVLTSNSAATNDANLATLYAAAPNNTTFYVPPGDYPINAGLTMNRDIRAKFKGAGRGRSRFTTSSTTATMFAQTVAGFYIDFEDLGFISSVTRTAGAAISAVGNNAYFYVRGCEFQNQFNGLDWSGTTAGNVGGIYDCHFNSPAAGGRQIRINGSNINTFITNVNVNCTGVACSGVEINSSGAVQVVGCDWIGGTNTLLVNATGTVSALYFTNVFFDQATLGSTVKFTGSGAVSRVKFLQCGITTGGGSGLVALEIAGTGSGTSIPEALDFMLCDFYNAGFTGTTTGILATGVRGFDLSNCRISGFSFGVDVTPYSANGVTNFNIQGCTVGPTENFAGNGVGIRINAGSFSYGSSSITDNDLSGNTTSPIVQNGNFAGQLDFNNNQGLINGVMSVGNLQVTNVATYEGSLAIPANSLTTKTRLRSRLVFVVNTAAANTTTVSLRYGTAGSTADATIWTAAFTGTAAVGFAVLELEISFPAINATTGQIHVIGNLRNGNNAATGFNNQAISALSTTTSSLNTATANAFLGLVVNGSIGTATVTTLMGGTLEVVSQGY